MSKISDAIYEINYMDDLAKMDSTIHRIHPLIKLIVTIAYIWMVVSFHKYNIAGLFVMTIYLIITFTLSEVSFWKSIQKLRMILPICIFMGIFNPFFDHVSVFQVHGFVVTGGMISALTLIMKGIMSVLASYLLIATTGIEKLCYALNILHVPEVIVTQILLTYRYITVLLSEANHIYQAYSLRAPRQKGVQFKVWGSLIGQLLFRSIDRASSLYDSMILRGYTGEFYYINKKKCRMADLAYGIVWIAVFLLLKNYNIPAIVGNLFA